MSIKSRLACSIVTALTVSCAADDEVINQRGSGAGATEVAPEAAPPVELNIVNGEEIGADVVNSVGAVMNARKPSCTGTLIKPSVVLTAAHCVVPSGRTPFPASSFRFSLSANANGQWENAHRLKLAPLVHPDYYNPDRKLRGFDVALLKLSTRITGKKMYPVAQYPTALKGGTTVTVVGYGLDETGAGLGIKRRGSMAFAGLSPAMIGVPASTFWTFATKAMGQQIAPADSGGPAILTGNLVGVIVGRNGDLAYLAAMSDTVGRWVNDKAHELEGK